MSKCLDTYYLNLTYYLHLLPLNEQIIEIKKLHRYIEKYPQFRDTFHTNKYSILKKCKYIKDNITKQLDI